jgi:hypothetical protein
MPDDSPKSPAPLPDWLLERLAQGELSPEAEREALRRLADEPSGTARLAQLKADDASVLATYPPEMMAARIADRLRRDSLRRARMPSRRSRGWYTAVLGLSAVGAAVLVLVALPPVRQGLISPWESDTRLKGIEPTLLVFRRTSQGVDRLADGAEVREGDQLQLAYVSGGQAYGAIVSIDGRGVVTQHFPEPASSFGGGELPNVKFPPRSTSGNGPQALSHAYALDDAPDFERFFFVTSDASFRLADVLAAARALAVDPQAARVGKLTLPRGFSQTSITLRKVQP